jgi:hypothetical protein
LESQKELTLILDDQSEIVVERVKGNISGDVKVYLENGLIRDENLMHLLQVNNFVIGPHLSYGEYLVIQAH